MLNGAIYLLDTNLCFRLQNVVIKLEIKDISKHLYV